MSPKPRKILEKSEFCLRALMCQHSFKPVTEFELLRKKTVDHVLHEYHAKRVMDEETYNLELSQDGVLVTFSKPIASIADIANELVRICKSGAIVPQHATDDWEAFIFHIADQVPARGQELEKIAAFVQFMQECCFNTTNDIQAIGVEYFPELKETHGRSKHHLTERYLLTDSDVDSLSLNETTFANPTGNIKGKYVFLKGKPKLQPSSKDYEIDDLFRKRMSKQLLDVIFSHFQPERYYNRAVLDEMSFRLTLERIKARITPPPQFILPKFKVSRIQVKPDADRKEKGVDGNEIWKQADPGKSNAQEVKTQEDVANGMQHLNECLVDYIKKTESTPGADMKPQVNWSWYIEAQIGMGKTSLAYALFSHCYELYMKNEVAPILIKAKDISGTKFKDIFYKDFKNETDFIESMRSSCKIFKRKMVFIVDGLDEIDDSKIQSAVISNCAELASDNVFIVITSRPFESIRVQATKEFKAISIAELEYASIVSAANLGLTDAIIDTYYLFSAILDPLSNSIISYLKTPMLLPCLVPLFQIDEKGERPIVKKVPLTSMELLDRFYIALLDHAKGSGAIPRKITLDEIIRAGVNIASRVATGKKLDASLSIEYDLLRSAGLIIGNADAPEFMHDIIKQDMTARAIAEGNTELRPSVIFKIINQNPSIGEQAISHACKLNTIKGEQFDVFEALYDDNGLNLSKLKALTWRARGKGPTPAIDYYYKEYLQGMKKKGRHSEAFEIIGVLFPEFESLLLERGYLKFFYNDGISEGNIKRFLEVLASGKVHADSTWILGHDDGGMWLRVALLARDPLPLILDACPGVILKHLDLALIDILFPAQSKDFFKKYLLKMLASATQEQFLEVLRDLLRYQNAFPKISSLSSDQRLKIILFLKNIFDKLDRFFRPESGITEILKDIIPLTYAHNDLFHFFLEFFINQRDKGATSLYLSANKEVVQKIIDNFSFEEQFMEFNHKFVSVLLESEELMKSVINRTDNTDILAYIYEAFLFNNWSKKPKANEESFKKDIAIKLKQLLRDNPDTAGNYSELLVKGLYRYKHPAMKHRQIDCMTVWIEPEDIEQLVATRAESRSHRLIEFTPEAKSAILKKVIKFQDLSILDYYHVIGWPFLDFLRNEFSTFKTFFDELLKVYDPVEKIGQLIRNETRMASFEACLWKFVLDYCDRNEDFPGIIIESFTSIPMPDDIKKQILSSDSLSEKFLKLTILPNMHETVRCFYDEVIDVKSDIFKKQLSSELSGYSQDRFLIGRAFLRYDTYRDTFLRYPEQYIRFVDERIPVLGEERLLKNDQFLTDCVEMLSKYGYRYISLDHPLYAAIKSYLEREPQKASYKELYGVFLPRSPVSWLDSVRIEQHRSKEKLEGLGIDVDSIP